ncbi:sugar-binding transcriptional regulator [Clostridium sp. 19966]|uniref:sugar-binding transcriptional regulator n=1 Tax=Clostridium sp. 19966 TaxID=2768166 RepID=UPI0028DF1599|nr:sugar-binding domain-containing protein [Clostridium sp. 19966]MDT8717900.1 sugar-binding transcriptional regulator [Clostridium sp. 19966]
MEEILKLQQKIVPELIELLDKRYNILRTIYYNQPLGRRMLANSLSLGERVVRTEIDFLKSADLISINTLGMTVTPEGEKVVTKLKEFIHEIKGLTDIEKVIKEKLQVRNVIVVPGDMDEDTTVLKEMARIAANYVKASVKNNMTIAITGGTTIKEVIDNVPKVSNLHNVLVVPARGGMGRTVEIQANTLAAKLANRLGGSYKLLHIPDNLSSKAFDAMINEKDIKEVVENIRNANVLIYGIGRADEMARRRGVVPDKLEIIKKLGAVGEAFGCYFNREGNVIYSTPNVGINNNDIKKIEYPIAVSGGKSKAEAILATEKGNVTSVLITDEGAAREILKILQANGDNVEFLR